MTTDLEREENRAYQNIWRAAHRDEVNLKQQQRRAAGRAEVNRKERERYARKKAYDAAKADRQADARDHRRKVSRAHYALHKDELNARRRAYRARLFSDPTVGAYNIERANAGQRRRYRERARKVSNG